MTAHSNDVVAMINSEFKLPKEDTFAYIAMARSLNVVKEKELDLTATFGGKKKGHSLEGEDTHYISEARMDSYFKKT